MGKEEGISTYVRIRIGGIAWNYKGLLIGFKTRNKLDVKLSRQAQVYLRFNDTEIHTMRFGPMEGLMGCVGNSIESMFQCLAPNRPDTPVFGRWPFFHYVVVALCFCLVVLAPFVYDLSI